MKRTGNLLEQIVDRENLRKAFANALRGKRSRPEVRQFAENLEANPHALAAGIRSNTVQVGRCRQFVIYDPKERIITAPRFAERVLHHALMNVCGPVLDRWLIDDTFACRVGKGRVAALRRAAEFAKHYRFFLKIDIRKYFDSVCHNHLLDRLALRFKDPALLALLERIVRSFRPDSGTGLPIGSLTSQHFANFYLGWLDRFAKETLRVPGYVRYMDDMVFWSNDNEQLREVLEASKAFLSEELALEIKTGAYQNRVEHGLDFLGARLFPYRLRLNRRSKVRFQRKVRTLERLHENGIIDEAELCRRVESAVAFTKSAGVRSWQFRTRALKLTVTDFGATNTCSVVPQEENRLKRLENRCFGYLGRTSEWISQ